MKTQSRKIISITLILFLFILSPGKAKANWDSSFPEKFNVSATENSLNLSNSKNSTDILDLKQIKEPLQMEIGEVKTFEIPDLNKSWNFVNSDPQIVQVEINNYNSYLTQRNKIIKFFAVSEGETSVILSNSDGNFIYTIHVKPSIYNNTTNLIFENTLSDLSKFATTNGLFGDLSWQSSDTNIVEVNNDGLALGVNPGNAEITISNNNYPISSYNFNVEVRENKVNTFKLEKPILTGSISCNFYGYKNHNGIDIATNIGTKVVSSEKGTVIKVEHLEYSYGNYIVIEHQGGITTKYAHLSETNVNVGDIVEKGEIIGLSGSTGNSTGPHLHFEVIINNENVDPETLINFNDML